MDDKNVTQSKDTSQTAPKTVVGDNKMGGMPNNKLWFIVAGVALLLAIVAGIYFWMQGSQKAPVVAREVKIGLLGPFTGDTANYGEVMKHGAEMALRDFNKEGLTIKILERDTGCDPAKAAAAARELIDQDGVIAIIGELCSGATLEVLKVANEKKVLLMSPASSSSRLTTADDFFFRTYPTDIHQSSVTAKLMYDRGIRSIAIMYTDEPYGKGVSEVVGADFEKLGGKVVVRNGFPRAETNFTERLNTVAAANPDAIYLASNGVTASAAIVAEAKLKGLDMQIFGSDALKDTGFLADVGEAGEGMIVVAVTPGNRAFLDEYKATYGAEPANATGSQAYDAFMALAQAIGNGATNGEELRQALPKTDFQGKSGPIKFDATGDLATSAYLIYTIKDGQFVLLEQ